MTRVYRMVDVATDKLWSIVQKYSSLPSSPGVSASFVTSRIQLTGPRSALEHEKRTERGTIAERGLVQAALPAMLPFGTCSGQYA